LGAKIIVTAPCCHKQIRNEITASSENLPFLKYGILLERQAEMITDTIRALILEHQGYETKVFEFVSTDHTPKNIMITAIRSARVACKKQIAEQIRRLKDEYGIKTHYLETVLKHSF
jgi:hypothetical protein